MEAKLFFQPFSSSGEVGVPLEIPCPAVRDVIDRWCEDQGETALKCAERINFDGRAWKELAPVVSDAIAAAERRKPGVDASQAKAAAEAWLERIWPEKAWRVEFWFIA